MIDNGYKCHSLIIEVKQNSGGLKNADIRSRDTHGNPSIEKVTKSIAKIMFLIYYCPLNMFLCRIIRFLAKDKPPLKR